MPKGSPGLAMLGKVKFLPRPKLEAVFYFFDRNNTGACKDF